MGVCPHLMWKSSGTLPEQMSSDEWFGVFSATVSKKISENFKSFRESLVDTDGTADCGATFILAYTLRCSV